MRLRSILHRGEPAVALESDGGLLLVPGLSEIGVETPIDVLRAAAATATEPIDDGDVVLRPVVPNPRRVVCLGLNYNAHVEETGRDLPTYPVLFVKWASSLIAAGAEIALPPESAQVDFEAELAVVIGKPGRRIAREAAYEHVAGLTVANDVTMRDFQYKTHQWLQGKAWDASTPLGPALVTLDEVDDPGRLDISLTLNGETMQSSNTDRLIFDIPTIVATVSEFTALEPGDVLLTGTPGGVGYRRDPKVLLKPGDRMTVTIEGVGTQESVVVAEAVA
ncbi:fumarylacetoacetate hydrolase family protein [Conexibacter sp. CPCC 206217]|uniref:fumarylacetoacetate hydrolase family protein n=1 Tax=Conexibacter sp. CPCC 206217 TaxID=3064574 RepID=UPI002724AB8F|nr:fumarylacetoacetate hydrolase family protein [Conexibacter sp. CPCC 206217]MDO8212072.1 fumarylacetoacetate hydrolase family protein [Conexibacter sp. CPCC 206217]